MAGVTLALAVPAARQPGQRVELGQCANQGVGATGQGDRAKIAPRLVRLPMPRAQCHRTQQHRWPQRERRRAGVWSHHLDDRRHYRAQGDEREALKVQPPETAKVEVLEMREFVSDDGDGFVAIQAIHERAAHQHGRPPDRRQSHRVDERSSTKIDLLQADGRKSAAPGAHLLEARDDFRIVHRPRAKDRAKDDAVSFVPCEEDGREYAGHGPVVRFRLRHQPRRHGQEQPETEDREHESREEREIASEAPALFMQLFPERVARAHAREHEQGQRPGEMPERDRPEHGGTQPGYKTVAHSVREQPFRDRRMVAEREDLPARPHRECSRKHSNKRGKNR